MEKMGKYCKAYMINRLREFNGWTENAQNARKEKCQTNDVETEGPRILTEDDYLYLQEDYTVTDGIFLGKNVIFDNVTPEWEEYCKNTLKFEIPLYETASKAAAAEQSSDVGN